MTPEGLSFAESGSHIFLRANPCATRPPLTPHHLLQCLQDQGFADCAVDFAALESLAQECNTRDTPFALPIAQRHNAQVQVHVAPDAMSAQLSITPAQGGQPASMADIAQALHDAGVLYGIDEAALLQACQTGTVDLLPIAQGQAAEDGKDAEFEELTVGASNRAPKIDANGLIDYREHGAITIVHQGDVLMRRIPATPGTPGHSVFAEPIAPRPGRDEPFTSELDGVRIDEHDPNLLRAERSGQPVRLPCGMRVEPVLRLDNVDLASGNIYFDGTVEVVADVHATMKVRATGDIVVGGTVEGATLDAGGHVHVRGGVIAAAQVQAGGSITARFAQGAHLHAGTVIALDDMAMECTLHAGNQIVVGAKNPQRGRLLGGSAQALMLIKTPYLGSSKAGLTRIIVGSNPELETAYNALQERIAMEKTNEENLQKLVQHLSKAPDPKGMLDKVRAAWRVAVQTWGQSLAQRSDIEQQLLVARNARIELGVGSEGMLELGLGTRKTRLQTDYGSGVFSLDSDNRLIFTNPMGQARPC